MGGLTADGFHGMVKGMGGRWVSRDGEGNRSQRCVDTPFCYLYSNPHTN